jgi:hypothetical protein
MFGTPGIAADGLNDAKVKLRIDVIGRELQDFLEYLFGSGELAEPD